MKCLEEGLGMNGDTQDNKDERYAIRCRDLRDDVV